ncbi:MAG: S1C family serine protease [Clostridium sp.]
MVHKKNINNNKSAKKYNEPEDQSNIEFKINKSKKIIRIAGKLILGAIISLGTVIYIVMVRNVDSNNQYYKKVKDEYGEYIENYNMKISESMNNIKDSIVVVKKGVKQSLGIIYKEYGYIITSNNISIEKGEVNVLTDSGESYLASEIGTDAPSSLMLIKIDAKSLKPAVFADCNGAIEGDEVIYFTGNEPYSKEQQAFLGSIVSKGKKIFENNLNDKIISKYYNILKVDNTIDNKGDYEMISNKHGEILALNFEGNNKEQDEIIAITSNDIRKITDNIIENQHIVKNPLGIVVKNAKPRGGSGVQGAYIQEVISDAKIYPEYKQVLNFRPADIIIAVDEVVIKNVDDLAVIVKEKEIGEKIICRVWRFGEIIDITLVIQGK